LHSLGIYSFHFGAGIFACPSRKSQKCRGGYKIALVAYFATHFHGKVGIFRGTRTALAFNIICWHLHMGNAMFLLFS